MAKKIVKTEKEIKAEIKALGKEILKVEKANDKAQILQYKVLDKLYAKIDKLDLLLSKSTSSF